MDQWPWRFSKGSQNIHPLRSKGYQKCIPKRLFTECFAPCPLSVETGSLIFTGVYFLSQSFPPYRLQPFCQNETSYEKSEKCPEMPPKSFQPCAHRHFFQKCSPPIAKTNRSSFSPPQICRHRHPKKQDSAHSLCASVFCFFSLSSISRENSAQVFSKDGAQGI